MSKERKVYSKNEMESFKTDLINYDLWRQMDKKQQAELLNYYETQFTTKELSELWNVKMSSIHNHRYQLKKLGLIQKSDKKKKVQLKPQKVEKVVSEKDVAISEKSIVLEVPKNNIETIKVKNESPDDVVVNIKDFMKILEIQEKMANMIEEQNKRKNSDGFSFNFKGDFSSDDLTKRLNKIIAIIQDEPINYGVRFELVELKKEEEKEEVPDNDPGNEEEKELLYELTTLKENLTKLQKELEEQKEVSAKEEVEEEPKTDWENGYQALKSSTPGLHFEHSEYEKKGDFNGIVHRNGKTLYQTFYVCPDCGDKNKHYLEAGTCYCYCKKCGKRLKMRDAVLNGKLTQDSFGNYYIAGKFKREEEKIQNQSLYETWNVQ